MDHPNVTLLPPSVTAGLIDTSQLAADLRCSERTLKRRRQAGMPFIKLGALTLFDPLAVRAWIMSHERRHDAPRRGRPAGKRVA